MRRMIAATTAIYLLTAGALAQQPASPAGTPADRSAATGRFIGHWELVSYVNFDDNGAPRDAGYESGRIMYDAHGNMSAQLMRAGRTRLSAPSTEAERAASYATFVGYYGRYRIDPDAGTVTHHVEGALNPNWVNTDLVRWYAFSDDGNRLMLSIRSGDRVVGTLTWRRMASHP